MDRYAPGRFGGWLTMPEERWMVGDQVRSSTWPKRKFGYDLVEQLLHLHVCRSPLELEGPAAHRHQVQRGPPEPEDAILAATSVGPLPGVVSAAKEHQLCP